MSKRKEPRPVQGGQAKTGEELEPRPPAVPLDEAGPPSDGREPEPPADEPTERVEAELPGTRARRGEEEPPAAVPVRIARLFREGLRLRNLDSSYGRMPIALLIVIGSIGIFADVAFGQALPEIQRHFKINLGSLITITTYVGLLGVLLSVPMGFFGDRFHRVRMYAGGGMVSSLGVLLTGFAPNKLGLIFSRTTTTVGDLGPEAVGFGLISDYVPQQDRGKSFAFRAAARQVATIVAPLAVGFLGAAFGWQLPFIIAGVLGMVASLAFFRMPEPIRGYHERKAWGADEETARRQQEAPSWGEAFRAAWGVRTLRRIAYSIPFTSFATRGFVLFFPFYLARTHGVDLRGRGIIGALGGVAALIGLTIGGPLVDKIIGRNPGRVVLINGFAGVVGAIATVGMALAPNVYLVVGISFVFTLVDSIVQPAWVSVASLVIPPRLRNLGLATLAYWTIPAYFGFLAFGGIAGNFGYRSAILFFVPFSLIGAIIYMSAGPFVEFDIRSASHAAMAAEEWRRAKEEGRGKLLVLRGVDVHYEAVQVLFGVDLDVGEGELIALLGTNGAGKSTLLRAISGTQEASGGAIVFDGRDITHVPPHEIASHGIAQTPGGRGIFPGLTVRENLQLAGWLYGQDARHKEEVEQIFTYFPILRDRLDQTAGSLSGGEQQMLTLSQAFLARPKLLMIDELSLGLSPAIVEQLLGIVRAIHERGTTIIIVEQSVNVALTLAQRAVFMEKGEVRFDGPTGELLSRPDIMRAVFLKGGASMSLATVASEPARQAPGDRATMLEVRGLTKHYGGIAAVSDVSFELRENETLGLIGPNGAGKTTVLEMISGYNPADAGQVIYDGKDITALSPDQRAKMGLIRRFQDAKLFPSLTVYETIAVAFERQVEVRSMVAHALALPQARASEQRLRRKVDALIEMFALEAYRDKFISEVSTGTRRIVDIACVLAAEPRVLLLDEPSSGLAQREAENLAPLLNQVRVQTGCSMIIIEHDMPLISAVSDELLAMDLGRVLMRGAPDEVLDDDRVVRSYLGTTEEVIQRSGEVKTK